jgi:alkanesulfonate monooxygenase SsuD/methylene tetrahydromethanopterin reductase-like flavin-dependent oxidoreductase (luciferase family)
VELTAREYRLLEYLLRCKNKVVSRMDILENVWEVNHDLGTNVANMAATLDHIAGGRFILGMGAGWNEMESSAYGLELGTLRERSDRFEEGMEIIVSLLANKETTFTGDFYQLTEAWCEPKPLQQHVPIVIGGKGRKRTLRTVARFADQWDMPFPESPQEWAELSSVLTAHCENVGRDDSEIDRSIHLGFTPESDPAELIAQAASFFDAGVDIVVWSWRGPLDPARLEKLGQAISAN